MKRILLIIFILPFILSFNKGGHVLKHGNEISVDIDGHSTAFNNITIASHTPDYGTYTLNITAFVNNYSTGKICITLKGLFPVKEGTYIKGLSSSGSHTPDISCTNQGSVYQTDEYPVSPITITISSISGTHVRGSFSGRLYAHSPGQAGSIELTNGKFDVDLNKQFISVPYTGELIKSY